MTRGVNALVKDAEATVTTLTPAEVQDRLGEAGLILVDLRDIRELKRDGRIPGSMHVPRGMLEFWIDPQSPYYRKEFDQAESLILYCNKGSRSALAAQSLQTMGMESVAHMAGGLTRWKDEIGQLEPLPERRN
ncbi:MAG: rhodanese [Gammaproteobacteria bacterium]|jgi:rhodanese-related sulfurtransferase|nr:rhodanese [Gammaproteobacteria bacterium]